jgi:hypothetical protein
MDKVSQGNSYNAPADCRIEISGWGMDNCFFVERTELIWAGHDEKHVQLARALPEGAMVFIRLLAPEPASGSVPVAYQVRSVTPAESDGHCRMRLMQLHPRSRESLGRHRASNGLEGSRKLRDTRKDMAALRHEEILQ